ncbi:Sialic acid TRAP transporter large permease protein SiaM [Nymphon striatum]|nr:Sialic acid TRAP transporter large permease protein SiaM [Nymphon striatum]
MRLVKFAQAAVGAVRGGLGIVNVFSSMLFGGISGSAIADISALGSILIPVMKDKGYDADYAVNVTVTSSIAGIIIPPSHNMIIYAIAVGAGSGMSISSLFLAGVVPGILMCTCLALAAYLVAVKRGYSAERFPGWEALMFAFFGAIPGLMTAVIIVGGVLSDDRHGDDPNRLCGGVRLYADLLPRAHKDGHIADWLNRQSDPDPVDDQRRAIVAWYDYGHGCVDLDLYADLPACCDGIGHGSGSVRDGVAGEPWPRPLYAARWVVSVRGMRGCSANPRKRPISVAFRFGLKKFVDDGNHIDVAIQMRTFGKRSIDLFGDIAKVHETDAGPKPTRDGGQIVIRMRTKRPRAQRQPFCRYIDRIEDPFDILHLPPQLGRPHPRTALDWREGHCA